MKDWWNFDKHICGVIADGVEKLTGPEGNTDFARDMPDVDIEAEIIRPLRAYQTGDVLDHPELLGDARHALYLFADHLSMWWD